MNIERFNVVLTGATLHGHALPTVVTRLAKVIGRDDTFAAYLLRGKPTKIKSDVDASAGSHYVEALEHIGVAVRLERATLEIDDDIKPVEAACNEIVPSPVLSTRDTGFSTSKEPAGDARSVSPKAAQPSDTAKSRSRG